MDLKQYIREVPDFPKPGISFKDITTLLMDHAAFGHCTDMFAAEFREKELDKIVAIESRGFLFGASLAHALDCGLVLARKPGKLPAATKSMSYELEYGTDSLEIHEDAIDKGDRVLVIDDLLATGGTAGAIGKLLEDFGAEVVSFAFVIELEFLNGKEKLNPHPSFSLVKY